MSFIKGLRCRECGKEYPARLQAGCEDCFAPLEVDYDYAAISKSLTQERIASRPANLWRYRELLPIEAEPIVGLASGWTPLVRADRLGRKLGLDHLYLKNDSVSYPTLSFKDRVTSMAVNKALEFKLEAVVVKLFEDGKAEIQLITDITVFIEGTWSRARTEEKSIDLKITGSVTARNMTGGGKILLTDDRKSIAGLKLQVLNKTSRRNVTAEFVAK